MLTRLFEEGLRMDKTLNIDLEISMNAPKCRGKFLGRIYLYSFCKRENKAIANTREFIVKNPQRGKPRRKKRDSTNLKRLQGVFSTLLQIQFSRVRSLVKEKDWFL